MYRVLVRTTIKWGAKVTVFFFSSNLTEMMGELFLPLDMPEPPKEGFFKGLFGGGIRSLDREELCTYCNRFVTIIPKFTVLARTDFHISITNFSLSSR